LEGILVKVEKKALPKKPRTKSVKAEVKSVMDSMIRSIETADKVARSDLAKSGIDDILGEVIKPTRKRPTRSSRAKSANSVTSEKKKFVIINPYTGNEIRLNPKTLKPIQHRKSKKLSLKNERTDPDLFANNHFEKQIKSVRKRIKSEKSRLRSARASESDVLQAKKGINI
jgi:hypothetical protein